MREKKVIQKQMIQKLEMIKAYCDDTTTNINIDSIISHNLEEMSDLLDSLTNDLLDFEYVITHTHKTAR